MILVFLKRYKNLNHDIFRYLLTVLSCTSTIFTSKNVFINFGRYLLVVSAIWCGNVFSTSIPRRNFGGIKVAVKRGKMIW